VTFRRFLVKQAQQLMFVIPERREAMSFDAQLRIGK
jgi:hypothetical protein